MAFTIHEVARMTFTVNEALGIVLDEALVHTFVQLVAFRGLLRGAAALVLFKAL